MTVLLKIFMKLGKSLGKTLLKSIASPDKLVKKSKSVFPKFKRLGKNIPELGKEKKGQAQKQVQQDQKIDKKSEKKVVRGESRSMLDLLNSSKKAFTDKAVQWSYKIDPKVRERVKNVLMVANKEQYYKSKFLKDTQRKVEKQSQVTKMLEERDPFGLKSNAKSIDEEFKKLTQDILKGKTKVDPSRLKKIAGLDDLSYKVESMKMIEESFNKSRELLGTQTEALKVQAFQMSGGFQDSFESLGKDIDRDREIRRLSDLDRIEQINRVISFDKQIIESALKIEQNQEATHKLIEKTQKLELEKLNIEKRLKEDELNKENPGEIKYKANLLTEVGRIAQLAKSSTSLIMDGIKDPGKSFDLLNDAINMVGESIGEDIGYWLGGIKKALDLSYDNSGGIVRKLIGPIRNIFYDILGIPTKEEEEEKEVETTYDRREGVRSTNVVELPKSNSIGEDSLTKEEMEYARELEENKISTQKLMEETKRKKEEEKSINKEDKTAKELEKPKSDKNSEGGIFVSTPIINNTTILIDPDPKLAHEKGRF